MRNMCSAAISGLLAFTLQATAATTPPQVNGWNPIRVDDGVSGAHCVNRAKEAVTIDLKKVIVTKAKGWFTEDKKVSLLFTVVLSGSTSSATKQVTFPRAYTTSLTGFPGGLFVVGDEESLINEYSLTGTDKVTNIHIDMSIANQSGNTAIANVALGLVNFTKSLPLPANALTALNAADSLSTSILNTVETDANTDANLAKQGGFQFDFSPDGKTVSGGVECEGQGETSGTKAFIRSATGTESGGIVDINKDYCFRVKTTGSYNIQFATVPNDGNCKAVAASGWRNLRNPQVALILNADTVENRLVNRPVAAGAESLARCKANGIPAERCNRN
jgi:hypothetical protein